VMFRLAIQSTVPLLPVSETLELKLQDNIKVSQWGLTEIMWLNLTDILNLNKDTGIMRKGFLGTINGGILFCINGYVHR